MTWLLKDTQLAELHERFTCKADKKFTVEFTAAVGRMMNISEIFVHKWFEHIKAAHLSALYVGMSRKRQTFCECLT